MGRDPLSSLPSLSNVKEWLIGFDINTFSDMSHWDTLGIWQGWKQLSLLAQITAQVHQMFPTLQGETSINLATEDNILWGPIVGSYSVKKRYQIQLRSLHQLPRSSTWKYI